MDPIEIAKTVLREEAQSILDLESAIDDQFEKALQLIAQVKGKLIITGVGKSGHIGRKLASTFSSTGTPSFFIHPSEASHGDLGMISKNDIVFAISYSGNTTELIDLINYCEKNEISLVALTGKKGGLLAKSANICLIAKVDKEADPMGLAPTSSSTAHLSFGDALALAVSAKKGFKTEHFAQIHPGGTLGKRLLTQVKHIMHQGENVPLVNPDSPIMEVVKIMTHRLVRGVAGVVKDEQLVGVITDGDIRRSLQKENFSTNLIASDIMSNSPATVYDDEKAERVLRLLEEKKLQTFFVLNRESNKPVGAVNLHDLLSFGLQ